MNEPFETGTNNTQTPNPTANDGNEFDDASEAESNLTPASGFTNGKLLRFLSHTDPRISPDFVVSWKKSQRSGVQL